MGKHQTDQTATQSGLPPRLDSLEPVDEYTTALDRLASIQGLEGPGINPVCRTRLLTHGEQTQKAIVLVHGLSNCPAQYTRLGPLFYERGYNVLIPRMPHHGLTDRLTDELGLLTEHELREFSDHMVDIAGGLGRQVTVAGLSAGGVVAAWCAQSRREVAKAVLISPALGLFRLGPAVNRLLMKVFNHLPNLSVRPPHHRQLKGDGPSHQYLRHSSRGIGAVLRLSAAVFRAAGSTNPAAGQILVITNANDFVVDNNVTRRLVKLWQARIPENIKTHEFPARLKLAHDLIDPENPDQQTDLVYPEFLDLIDGPV